MNAARPRRLVAEFTGTGLLAAVVAGSGIAAADLGGGAHADQSRRPRACPRSAL